MTFSEFTYISILFSNDLKFIKLHAAGHLADNVRDIAESLAVYTEATADEFSKQAIMRQEGVDCFSNVKNYIDESVWKPETDEIFTMDKFVNFLNTKGRDYLDAIKDLRKEDNENIELTNIESFWNEEINFKNASRMLTVLEDTKEPQGDAINPDTQDEFNKSEKSNTDNNEDTDSDDDNDEENDESDEDSDKLPVFPSSLEAVIKDYVDYMSDVSDKKNKVESTIDYVKKLVKDND